MRIAADQFLKHFRPRVAMMPSGSILLCYNILVAYHESQWITSLARRAPAGSVTAEWPAGSSHRLGPAPMMRFHRLQGGYQGRAVTPVVNGELAAGSMTALVGANGTGKSTLLKTIAGLLPPVAGRCELQLPRKALGWLPQRSELDTRFPLTVYELVAMGCWPRCGWFGGITRALRQEIDAALEAVQMRDFATAQPAMLSGGQLQRVLFARLMLQRSQLWLLDEPFNGIDTPTITLLMSILEQQQRAGTTLLVVLHDKLLVARHFRDVLSLDERDSAQQPRLCRVAS
jgi:zinc/manganese transport system ATP-binding protein